MNAYVIVKTIMNNKDFYKHVLRIAIPIMIQNGITNFVSMLDNIMVGQIGTNAMSSVAIVNQLMFVFNLCIFGGLAGIGIFTAQFYGRRNHDGVRSTFRLMVLSASDESMTVLYDRDFVSRAAG